VARKHTMLLASILQMPKQVGRQFHSIRFEENRHARHHV